MKQNNPYGGEYIDHSIIQQSEGALKSGKITQKDLIGLKIMPFPPSDPALCSVRQTLCAV